MFRLGRVDRFSVFGRLRPQAAARRDRSVVCYRCGGAFESDGSRIAEACPHCRRPVHAADILIDGPLWTHAVRTCGRVRITAAGRLSANEVVASAAVEVLGVLEGPVRCGGLVSIGARARVRGSITAAALAVEPGAVMEGGPCAAPGPKPWEQAAPMTRTADPERAPHWALFELKPTDAAGTGRGTQTGPIRAA